MKEPSVLYVYFFAVLGGLVLAFYLTIPIILTWTPLGDGAGSDSPLMLSPGSGLGSTDTTARTRATCGRCGVVESVREVGRAPDATGLGAVAGSLIGQQAAGSYGRDLLAVIGAALGGASVRGGRAEAGSNSLHEVGIRYEDGSRRVLTVRGDPALKPGDRVKVIAGRIWPDD